MASTAADILVETLIAWDIDTVFGLPGDGINGIMESLRKRQDDVRFVQVRHEEAAAFMACAYAKWTGRLGCCLATSGPGGSICSTAFTTPSSTAQPVLAITGLQFHDLLHTWTQQDVELDKLFMDVAVYNARVMGPAHTRERHRAGLPHGARLSRRGARHHAGRCAVDGLAKDVRSRAQRTEPRLGCMAEGAHVPPRGSDETGRRRAQRRQEIVHPGGTRRAWRGGRTGCCSRAPEAPVAKPLLGKASFPDDSPYCVGGVGLLGTRPAQEALESLRHAADRRQLVPLYRVLSCARAKHAASRSTSIPKRIGLRYPVEVGLVGDSAAVLRTLLAMLDARRTGTSSNRRRPA